MIQLIAAPAASGTLAKFKSSLQRISMYPFSHLSPIKIKNR